MSLALIYVCSLFMIGRNAFSLFFKLFDLIKEDRRKERTETKSKLFVLIILILTAILGLVCGVGMLLPNQIFGYYLYFIVSGMMVYSYLTYAGTCFEEKKWFMFVVCILVIILTIVLAILLAILMGSGTID